MISKEREIEITKRWGKIKSRSDNDLKNIAKDLYNCKIYTDRHCAPNLVQSTFMVMLFMGPTSPKKPKHPNTGGNVAEDRDNALYDVLQLEKDKQKYKEEKEEYKFATKLYQEEYLNSIGLIFEYMDKAGSMSVNGQPIFMSLNLLNKEDTEKMFEYYEKYKAIRATADNF